MLCVWHVGCTSGGGATVHCCCVVMPRHVHRSRRLHGSAQDASIVDWQYNETSVLENSVLGKVVHTYGASPALQHCGLAPALTNACARRTMMDTPVPWSDRVFPPGSTNAQVYAGVARGVVEKVLDGTCVRTLGGATYVCHHADLAL